ncbi:hypothetical protein, partial [Sporisorium scitamineum]
RTSLPTLGSGKIVVETPTKEALDVVCLMTPVLKSHFSASSQTPSSTSSSGSAEISEDEDDLDTEDLSDFHFSAMQRCPSLTASQDSLSPSPTPSPSKLSFFPTETEHVATAKADKPATYGTVLVVGVGFVGAHLMERFSSAYEVVAFDVSEIRCQYLRK